MAETKTKSNKTILVSGETINDIAYVASTIGWGGLPASTIYGMLPRLLDTTYIPSTPLFVTTILTGIVGAAIGDYINDGKRNKYPPFIGKATGGTIGGIAGIGLYSALSIYNPNMEIRQLKPPEKLHAEVLWQDRLPEAGHREFITAGSWRELAEMAQKAKAKPAELA